MALDASAVRLYASRLTRVRFVSLYATSRSRFETDPTSLRPLALSRTGRRSASLSARSSTAEDIGRFFESVGLTVFDVEELATHGGSLRVFTRHTDNAQLPTSSRVSELIAAEEAAGLYRTETYDTFAERVRETKRGLLAFLIEAKRQGKKVVGYGAPGQGNTLLNYCGIRTDFIDFTVDKNPYKHGRFTPGTRIPILPPDAISKARPDYLLIMPWNLKDEIMEQERGIRAWGGRFVVAIPELRVFG